MTKTVIYWFTVSNPKEPYILKATNDNQIKNKWYNISNMKEKKMNMKRTILRIKIRTEWVEFSNGTVESKHAWDQKWDQTNVRKSKQDGCGGGWTCWCSQKALQGGFAEKVYLVHIHLETEGPDGLETQKEVGGLEDLSEKGRTIEGLHESFIYVKPVRLSPTLRYTATKASL